MINLNEVSAGVPFVILNFARNRIDTLKTFMESNTPTQNTTNTDAAAKTQQSTRPVNDYHKRQDGESKPYRPRGEFRGNYRGRQFQDGEERPFRRGRGGRGRGGFNREGENNDNENGEKVLNSDLAYTNRPRFQNDDGTFRGRGGRGGRGRGNFNNYENARPVRYDELASDEEIVECTEE